MKFLVVDDFSTMRRIVRNLLKELGFTVITANDGREGVEQFKQNPDISFVILDLTMPHMDGEEAFRQIRETRADTRVLLISGFNEQQAIERFTGKGLAGFLQKPFTVHALREKLQEIFPPN